MYHYQVNTALYFLNDIVNDLESTGKLRHKRWFKSEPTFKLINRIPGLHLLISGLAGSISGTHVESLGKGS